MEFRELSDGEWEVIRPLPPPRTGVGRPRINDRPVVNGILYVLVTGWIIRHAGVGLGGGVL
jgi:transposase